MDETRMVRLPPPAGKRQQSAYSPQVEGESGGTTTVELVASMPRVVARAAELLNSGVSVDIVSATEVRSLSDDGEAAACRRIFIGDVLERVRDRIPHQSNRQLVNSIRQACAGLREMWARQRDALAAEGYQVDAVTLAIEEVLLEELESWLE